MLVILVATRGMTRTGLRGRVLRHDIPIAGELLAGRSIGKRSTAMLRGQLGDHAWVLLGSVVRASWAHRGSE